MGKGDMVMAEKTIEEVAKDNRMLDRLLTIARRETLAWQAEAVRLAIENEDLAKRLGALGEPSRVRRCPEEVKVEEVKEEGGEGK